MTAETDLLPCPFCGSPAEIDKGGFGEVFAACSKCWCHMGGAWSTTESDAIAAWNRRAIAAKDAEIEALRAEVERLTFEMERLQQQYDERTACMIVHRGSALACSDAVRAAYSEEHERAERLAEALCGLKDLMLRQVKWMPCDCGCPQQRTPDGPHSVTWLRAAQQVEIAIGKLKHDHNQEGE